MIDMSPEHGEEMRSMFGVADGYYIAVPEDPKPKDAKKLINETAGLCDRIVKSGEYF